MFVSKFTQLSKDSGKHRITYGVHDTLRRTDLHYTRIFTDFGLFKLSGDIQGIRLTPSANKKYIIWEQNNRQ